MTGYLGRHGDFLHISSVEVRPYDPMSASADHPCASITAPASRMACCNACGCSNGTRSSQTDSGASRPERIYLLRGVAKSEARESCNVPIRYQPTYVFWAPAAPAAAAPRS
jgi:hypothetical protein